MTTTVAKPKPLATASHPAEPTRLPVVIFAATIFLSACLLFQVQLIISKYILPWFGGTPSVWTTAMVFFQVLLLGGYVYAHLISTRLRSGRQAMVHIALLGISVLLVIFTARAWPAPILPSAAFKPVDVNHPTWDIIVLLATSVALPFFLLSTTGPLLQSWYARAVRDKSAYRLYAVSNLGSLLGLLSYPFLAEPLLKLRTQGWLWALGYVVFAVGAAHLLTREAMKIYLQHLSGPDAVLAVHISSKSLDLGGVLTRLAREFGFSIVRVDNPATWKGAVTSNWVLMSYNPNSITTDAIVKHGYSRPTLGSVPLWTDDYSNILQIVRFQ